MSTRRERNRATTVQQIKTAALRQVQQEGAPALSIRGVARAIGMSPAGLYRYYDGRDALLTDLLVDAYDDLADAVGAHAAATPGEPEDPVSGMLAAIAAYRAWAVANPARFLLIFGTPVPGYEAPPEGPTVAANRRMGQVFFMLAAQAWAMGMIVPPAQDHQPQQGEPELLAELRQMAPDLPAALVPRMLAGWALWHGLVTLEVTGQLHWIYPDTGQFFSARMSDWMAGFTGHPRAG